MTRTKAGISLILLVCLAASLVLSVACSKGTTAATGWVRLRWRRRWQRKTDRGRVRRGHLRPMQSHEARPGGNSGGVRRQAEPLFH